MDSTGYVSIADIAECPSIKAWQLGPAEIREIGTDYQVKRRFEYNAQADALRAVQGVEGVLDHVLAAATFVSWLELLAAFQGRGAQPGEARQGAPGA